MFRAFRASPARVNSPIVKSFLLVVALVIATAVSSAQTPETSTFALSPADVPKVVIFMYEGGKTWIEVTFNKEKQAEFAKLAADNVDKPIKIVLNGKPFGERTFKDANVGHSIKLDVASPEEAFATATALLKR